MKASLERNLPRMSKEQAEVSEVYPNEDGIGLRDLGHGEAGPHSSGIMTT
jgi:hypothetical protein